MKRYEDCPVDYFLFRDKDTAEIKLNLSQSAGAVEYEQKPRRIINGKPQLDVTSVTQEGGRRVAHLCVQVEGSGVVAGSGKY